jgi:Transposase DDE domain group 1
VDFTLRTAMIRSAAGHFKPAATGSIRRRACHRFRANEVRLWLSVIAYNLWNLWRRLALPSPVATWPLTSLQQRLLTTGNRLIKHARYYWLLQQTVAYARKNAPKPCASGEFERLSSWSDRQ